MTAAPAFEPFHGVPAAEPEPPYFRQPEPQPQTEREPKTGSSWFDVIGIGIVAALLGFAGGYQSARQEAVPADPPIKIEPTKARNEEATKAATPVLTGAKSALLDFLAAPDWKSRGKLVLFPETILPRMESFHAKHPDGPTEVTRIAIEHCEANATSNLMLVILRVYTSAQPTGFPVAVAETADGWKIDWQPFVEFKDELFIEFVTGKAEDTGSFHLLVQPSTETQEADDKASYILSDPVKQREFLATVRKGTDAAKGLADITKDGLIATPVVDLTRHASPDGSYELEIVGLPATNWRPADR